MTATAVPALSDLGPVAQLRAGRLVERLARLFVGLFLYGVSLALMVRDGAVMIVFILLAIGAVVLGTGLAISKA